MLKSSILFFLFLELACSTFNVTYGVTPNKKADSVWVPLIEQIKNHQLDGNAITVSDLTLNNVDFKLQLNSGTLHLFEPLIIKGEPTYYGGYFVGHGQFRFKPKPGPEKFQVQRFYKTDSVLSKVTYAILYFNESEFSELSSDKIIKTNGLLNEERKNLDFGYQAISYYSDYDWAFLILKNLLHPQSDSFIFVHSINSKFDHDQYVFDPLEREEVNLRKAYPEWDGAELVCKYHRNADESLHDINGPRKDQISLENYTIDASIDLKGVLRAEVQLDSKVMTDNTQLLTFYIHPEIEIKSIETGDGRPVEFIREKKGSYYLGSLHLFLPHAYSAGSPLVLIFKYHGKIADRVHGLYYVDASIYWYPRYGWSNWSHYELKFRSPKNFTLVASASLTDSVTTGDTLFTHWRTNKKESSVTFNIAGFETRTFTEEGLPEVTVFHNRPLHEAILKRYKEDWHKNIASTILDPIRLFSNVYGPPHRDYLYISEILYSHGESFPGFVNLPYWTFMSQNVWGDDLLIRAHEVAHQWWGSSVGAETYHDKWLSEGLAEFSSLRYCNTVVRSDDYFEKLREFRENVFSVRKMWFASGEESGPIILGPRTSSSKTKGDYQLIIYEKAALVLHMLRGHLTNWSTLDHSKFNDILKDFYQQFAGKNASTQDFRNVIEKHTGVDWGWFFNQWIYGTELPEYTFHKEIMQDKSDGIWRVHCTVEQHKVNPDFVVIMPLEIEFDDKIKSYTAQVVRGDKTEFTLAFEQKPKKIRLNPFEIILAKVKQ